MDFVASVKERVPLEEVLRRDINLKPNGAQYTALCPFHKEKTASFYVYPETHSYHCFGCHAHGDIFTYLMQRHGMTFTDALDQICRQYGIARPSRKESAADVARQQQFAALTRVADYYRQALAADAGRDARALLQQRGIDTDTQERFALGYAPRTAAGLHALGIAEPQLLDLGVLRRGDNGTYPLLRDRIIFPLHDIRKRVLGFSGRIIRADARAGKYINSPESPLFRKRELLYGLAHYQPGDLDASVIVEGQMDVLALHRIGIRTAVAAMGTAAQRVHFAQIFKRTHGDTVILALDADTAGGRALWRWIEAAVRELQPGRLLKIAQLPAGEDPDSYAHKYGAAATMAHLQQAQPLSDFFMQQLRAVADTPERLATGVRRVQALVTQIPDATYKALLNKRLGDAFGIPQERSRRPEPAAPPPQDPRQHQPRLWLAQLATCLRAFPTCCASIPLAAPFTVPSPAGDASEAAQWRTAVRVLLGLEEADTGTADDDAADAAAFAPDSPQVATTVALECLYLLARTVSGGTEDAAFMLQHYRAGTLPRARYGALLKKMAAEIVRGGDKPSDYDALCAGLRAA